MSKQTILTPACKALDAIIQYTTTVYVVAFSANAILEEGLYNADELAIGVLKELIAHPNDVMFILETEG